MARPDAVDEKSASARRGNGSRVGADHHLVHELNLMPTGCQRLACFDGVIFLIEGIVRVSDDVLLHIEGVAREETATGDNDPVR